MFKPDSFNVIGLKFQSANNEYQPKHYRVYLGKNSASNGFQRIRITLPRELAPKLIEALLWQLEHGGDDTVSITSDFGGMELVEDV